MYRNYAIFSTYMLGKKIIFLNTLMYNRGLFCKDNLWFYGVIYLYYWGYANCCICSVGSQCRARLYLTRYLALIIGGSCLGWIVQKAGLPTVLGELTLGMLIVVLGHYQLGFWPGLIANPTIQLLTEIGSILLLFEIGFGVKP